VRDRSKKIHELMEGFVAIAFIDVLTRRSLNLYRHLGHNPQCLFAGQHWESCQTPIDNKVGLSRCLLLFRWHGSGTMTLLILFLNRLHQLIQLDDLFIYAIIGTNTKHKRWKCSPLILSSLDLSNLFPRHESPSICWTYICHSLRKPT
jgi:hypothetical protein